MPRSPLPPPAAPPAGPDLSIDARGLRRSFGDLTVLDGVDLTVPTGSVCGLLGPNGAGKTTIVRILTTLLRADDGEAHVGGADVRRDPAGVRRRIGLVGQHAALDEILGARENLVMFGRLHHLPVRAARTRADELLEHFGLADVGSRPVSTFSGGMRRRLDLAAGMILRPRVLFLDEPTTGLDPQARLDVWASVRELVADGVTVLLTTQYLEEADRLAQTVCVLDGGRVAARGTPAELKATIGGDRIDVVAADRTRLGEVAAAVGRATHTDPAALEVDEATGRVTAPVEHRMTALRSVIRALDDDGLEVEDVGLRGPTLDEAYLRLVGHAAARPTDEPGTEDAPTTTTEVAA